MAPIERAVEAVDEIRGSVLIFCPRSLRYVDEGRLNLAIWISVQHRHLNAFGIRADEDLSANRVSTFFKLRLRRWIVERLPIPRILLAR
jgi:hypothetical protein